MAATIRSVQLHGKKVFAQAGREIGMLESVDIDPDTWRVVTLEIKMKRELLPEINVKRPMLGTKSVRVPVDQVSGITDTVVLRPKLEEITVVGEDDA